MTEMRVALLRGINVGGRTSLPMAELRGILETLGAERVATYIQSGNAVFRGEVAAAAVSEAIEAARGFRPHVLILSAEAFGKVVAACPFEGEGVHVWFTDGPPDAPGEEILALAAPTEAVHVGEAAAYLKAPDGIGRSKLAARLERALGVPATARNWKTVEKIAAMIEAA